MRSTDAYVKTAHNDGTETMLDSGMAELKLRGTETYDEDELSNWRKQTTSEPQGMTIELRTHNIQGTCKTDIGTVSPCDTNLVGGSRKCPKEEPPHDRNVMRNNHQAFGFKIVNLKFILKM